jgi:hypothetical protein
MTNLDLAADFAKLEPTRCPVCGWPTSGEDAHCKPGNCSMRPLPTPVEPQRAIQEYGSWAPEEWFHIKPRERFYTEPELAAREQRLVQVVVERAALDLEAMLQTRTVGYHSHRVLLEAIKHLRQLLSPENVAAMIAEAKGEK